MERFECSATDKTPYVVFDPAQGVLEVRGCSIHENADRFFLPLLERVEAYMGHPSTTTRVRFALTYFNSSSAKYLLDTLKMLDDLHASGGSQVTLEWYYDEGDLDMQEAGEDFKGLLDFPVKLVEGR
jgi:hypothetical protein